MMPDDDALIDRLIRDRERGFVHHAADRGGATNWGITKPILAEWRGHPVTDADIKALTRAEASDIYHAMFLKPFDLVTDPHLRELVFDTAVLHGVGRAKFMLQAALGVEVDGILGPQTRAAYARANLLDVYRVILRARFSAVGELVTKDYETLRRDLVDFLASGTVIPQPMLKHWEDRLAKCQARNAHGWCNRLGMFL